MDKQQTLRWATAQGLLLCPDTIAVAMYWELAHHLEDRQLFPKMAQGGNSCGIHAPWPCEKVHTALTCHLEDTSNLPNQLVAAAGAMLSDMHRELLGGCVAVKSWGLMCIQAMICTQAQMDCLALSIRTR